MSKYATYTGLVTNSDKSQVSLKEGELWPDDDKTVQEHPEFFTDTEPNSETAGAFQMEHQQRSSESFDGGAVEAKRMEGEHPRGYPLPGESEPTRANPLEHVEAAADEEKEAGREGDAKPAAKRSASAPKVERATRAPGEKRA